MKYSHYLETNQGFQTSVNLEFDLNKKDKIKGYIPTEQSVKVLGTFLKSFYFSADTQNRATVLIGPYGRGKSHLLLVLTALTSMDLYSSREYTKSEAKNMLKELCEKIESVDSEVGALAKEVVDSNIRTLPIIINSNSRDINQSFLVALHEALLAAGLEDLLPDTYFDTALEVIQKWENSVPDAYSKLKKELKKEKKTLEQLEIGLKRFDDESYDLFCKVYPSVAAGMKFMPMVSMDVVKLYMSVVDALCEQTNYTGINIIFDEFSKFLESNLEKSQMYNLKIIQDIAEAAARSEKKQIHFTCITHKDILEYSTSDSFKTVEGRFSKLYYVTSSEQSYTLISNAIIKKDEFDDFYNKNEEQFKKVIDIASKANVFKDLSDEDYRKKVVYGCFPLAPLTVYSLLKVSELVGQNERTLFTFLATNGEYTLGDFINRNHKGVEFLTIESVYDYFEELFRKEVFNAKVHSYWAKADSAIKQIKDENQIRIVKAVAIINMIKDGAFRTVPAHIKAALLMADEVFDNSILELQRKHIMTERDSSEFVMLTANGVDVQKGIENQIESKAIRISICDELNSRCDAGYIIPHEHNDKNCILRCFKKIFMTSKMFLQYSNADEILEDYKYDGIIIYIVDEEAVHTREVVSHISSFVDYPQIVICVSDTPFSGEMMLKRIVAAGQIKEQAIKNNDIHYLEEIEYFEEDLQKQVVNLVDLLYSPVSEHSKFYNCDGDLNINRQAVLNSRISGICDDIYFATPVVNNEMVNKRTLNTQNKKARDLVVTWLFEHSEDTIIPCMDGYGPEVSIFKSVFKFTGLDAECESNNDGINRVLMTIKKFVESAENKRVRFNALYKDLLNRPFGMRKGIIPLFIAYVLRSYKENVVVYYSGKEVEISAAVLNSINDSPEQFEILLEEGTNERERYLDQLESLFIEYKDKKVGSVNRVYSLMRSMQNWYRSLPEYTKKYTYYIENGNIVKLESTIIDFRSDLAKFDVNARELLFVNWVKMLSPKGKLDECAETIKNIKEMFDGHVSLYRKELCLVLVDLFSPGYKGTLPNAVIGWYKNLSDEITQHVFDSESNALLTISNGVNTYDENNMLDNLVYAFETIGIEDWGDNTAEEFIQRIKESINKITKYKPEKACNSEKCRVTISMPGVSVDKNFTSDEISPLAETALNNLSAIFEEYNDALEPNEKIAILANLMKKVVQ
jgi:hypothetical protein